MELTKKYSYIHAWEDCTNSILIDGIKSCNKTCNMVNTDTTAQANKCCLFCETHKCLKEEMTKEGQIENCLMFIEFDRSERIETFK